MLPRNIPDNVSVGFIVSKIRKEEEAMNDVCGNDVGSMIECDKLRGILDALNGTCSPSIIVNQN